MDKTEKGSEISKTSNEVCFKLITIGDSHVGKSSIIARYIDGNFYHNIPSTLCQTVFLLFIIYI